MKVLSVNQGLDFDIIINNGTIDNQNTINNSDFIENNGTINNEGTIENNSTIENNGTINNEGTISGNRGIRDNGGTITGSGIFNTLRIDEGIFIPSRATVTGSFNLSDSGTLQLFNPSTEPLVTIGGDANLNGGTIDFGDLSGLAAGSFTLIDGQSSLNINDGLFNSADSTVNSFDTDSKDFELIIQQDNNLVITVEASNTSPIANDDSVTTDEDSSITISTNDLLANDTDPNSFIPLTVISVDDTNTAGTVNFNDWGATITYDPNGQFEDLNNGEDATDSFTYTIDDGNGGTATASVNITINGIGESDNGGNNPTNGDDNLVGTGQKDTIDGGRGNDTIDGGNANDFLIGGNGSDSLIGGAASDTLDGGNGSDTLIGGNGKDFLDGGNGDDTLDGGVNQDILIGAKGKDLLDGGGGSDSLSGGNGFDTLIGGAANDTLDGGSGQDNLEGGKGRDTFVLAPDSGTDTIIDFELNRDFIGLSDGLGFGDLSFEGDKIISDGETLAVLSGIDTTSLDAGDFA